MRVVPTFLHGIADYVVGLIVVALPFYFGIPNPERTVFVTLGAAGVLYSLMTDYELGLLRILRVRFHLLLDVLFGILMLVIPNVLDIPPNARIASYVIGILALILAATTQLRARGSHLKPMGERT